MKKLLLLFIILFGFQPIYAQSHLFPKFIRKMLFEKDTTKHSSFFLLPVFSSAPETGVEVGGSILYSFYTDTLSTNTRVSNIFGYATITTKGQSRLSLSTNYWTPENRYHYTAKIGYINFPFNYYGVGNNTAAADKDPLGHKRFRLDVTAEKRFGKSVYLGLVAGARDYKFEDKQVDGIFETLPQQDKPGGAIALIGPSFVFDDRNNNTYTTKGAVVTAYFEVMKGIFSNNSYNGGFLNIEYAQFFSFSKKLVLGLNA
ncbi:MAG: polymerase, partial [Sphingobacteriaceae bacterium]